MKSGNESGNRAALDSYVENADYDGLEERMSGFSVKAICSKRMRDQGMKPADMLVCRSDIFPDGRLPDGTN